MTRPRPHNATTSPNGVTLFCSGTDDTSSADHTEIRRALRPSDEVTRVVEQ
jgi:hypothetical protein